jgi:site-specific DNA-methyltransferase (adenine-specific)
MSNFLEFSIENKTYDTAGSCTTAIAALNTNRNYICMEKEERYYNIGLKRVKEWHENKKK